MSAASSSASAAQTRWLICVDEVGSRPNRHQRRNLLGPPIPAHDRSSQGFGHCCYPISTPGRRVGGAVAEPPGSRFRPARGRPRATLEVAGVASRSGVRAPVDVSDLASRHPDQARRSTITSGPQIVERLPLRGSAPYRDWTAVPHLSAG